MSTAPRTIAQWLAWQESLHCSEIDMTLHRVQEVASRLDLLSPKSLVITVAGTNGKGSTIALFESILLAAGYRVGAYTSPHLLHYNERVRIQGENVSDQTFCQAFESIEQVRGDTSLTYFEFGTLAALQILQQAELDVMLLEVGLGGRLDAVNIVDPDLAVITSIGLDHTDWLGPDRESIGREKAGIMRSGIPVVCGDPSPPKSLLAHAQQLGAPLYCIGKAFDYQIDQQGWRWKHASGQRSGLPNPRLKGRAQFNNASSVLMGLDVLKTRLPVNQRDVRIGLSQASLMGRFQILANEPLVVVDVAHNAQAARSLAEALKAQPRPGKTYAVFSLLKDKEIAPILNEIYSIVDVWHVAGLEDVPRGQSMLQMLQRIEQTSLDLPGLSGHKDVRSALEAVLAQAEALDTVVIFGSFYVVAEVLKGRIMGLG